MAKKLQDISILDLMPSNIAGDAGVREAAQAFDEVLRDIIAKIPSLAILSNIGEITDHALLDMLAWQFHVDFYRSDMTLEVKREMVQRSLDWHTRLGTPSAVEEVVGVAWGSGVEIREWFETGRSPYTFMLSLNRPIPDEESLNELLLAIFATKNTRSWLDLIKSIMEYKYRLFVGIGVHNKDTITLGLDTPVRVEGEVTARVGAFLGVHGTIEIGFRYGDEITEPVKHTLTVVGGIGGGEFVAGTFVNVQATVPTGQQFVQWSDGNTDNPRRFRMPNEDVTLTAEFEPIPVVRYTLTIINGMGVTTTVQHEAGAQVPLHYGGVPAGQRFTNWTLDGVAVSTSGNFTLTMPARNATVRANYEPIPTFTLTVNGGTGGGVFTAGTVRTLAATVPDGQIFVQWSDGNAQNPRQFTMPANNVTLTAELEGLPVEIFVLGGTGGGTFRVGDSVTITAGTPPSGQEFSHWNTSEFGDVTENPFTFTVPIAQWGVMAFDARWQPIPVEPAGEIWYVFMVGTWSELVSFEPTGTATFEIDSNNSVRIYCDWDRSVIGEGNVLPNTTARIPIGSSYVERVPDGLHLGSSTQMSVDVHALVFGSISRATLVIRRGNDSLIRNGDMWFEVER